MMPRRVASVPVPDWLEALLATRFFLACAAHPASPRNECNMFCLDCTGAPPPPPPAFCYYCRAHRHSSHRVIQIRRSSYHDVVRVSEVEDVLDISGVQTYVINSARVLFLNERPQPRGAGAAAGKAAASPYNCEICGRALLDPFRFCSLGCKVLPFFFFFFPAVADCSAHQPTRPPAVPHRSFVEFPTNNAHASQEHQKFAPFFMNLVCFLIFEINK